MKVCATCGREFPDNQKFCPSDGSALRGKSASADLVGQVVAERYHIIKKLGEGGMGAVYLGEHVKMGRKSAIKVMAAAMSQDPDAISRFNREASNASRISHPNVCQIYDFGETPEGLIYLAMEYIEGQALKDLIEKEGALSPPRAASILRQSADALQAAHDLGIVHRDIKPDNIMVVQGRDNTDIVKVVDFGIARAVGGDESGQKVTKTGLVVGTPEYMSPEQLSGDKLDGRSDIYSLGLVLYRMLTGDLPFQADSAQEVMIKRLTDDPTPLDQVRPDLVFPPKMQLVMNVALARSAAERYQSASEFGRDTMDAVAGMATPETRVNVAPQGATHIMSPAEVGQATQRQEAQKKPAAKRPTEPAPVPAHAKKFPVVPVAGGVGAVAVLLGVAVFMMNGNKGAARQQTATNVPTDTSKGTTRQGVTTNPPAPTPGGTTTPGGQKRPGTTTNPPPVNPNNPPPTGGGAPNWADSLKRGNDAYDNDDYASARRLAGIVYNNSGLSTDTRGTAAVLMASSYGAVGNTTLAIEWYRKAQPLLTGERRQRIDAAITALGGTP